MANKNDIALGQMLALVRVARGMTQEVLAEMSGISQGLLSKAEKGQPVLDFARLECLAHCLTVPVARLTESKPPDGVLSACAFHRKRSSLPVSDAKRIRALLDLLRLETEDLIGGFVGEVHLRRQVIDDDGWTSAEDVARSVRKAWNLPAGPVENLVRAAEGAGVVVLERDLGAARIDAIGNWPQGHRPIFLMNSTTSQDRKRFTLAHEIGHAVMHPVPADGQEAEADRFASEFLMPAAQIRTELSSPTLAKAATLKAKWRVSMSALIRRSRDLGLISDYQYKMLNIELSKAGYRTREPVELPPEHPSLISDVISVRLHAGESMPTIARAARLVESDLNAVLGACSA